MNERMMDAISRAKSRREGDIGKMAEVDSAPTPNAELLEAKPKPKPEPDTAVSSGHDESSAKIKDRSSAHYASTDFSYTVTRQVQVDEDLLIENRVIGGAKYDERAAVYRQLRSQVLQQMRANDWRTLAITSPEENAGKTLTAANLAISLSQEVNQTVLLVDMDLRKPSVHEIFGVDCEYGLVDCMRGKAAIEDVLFNPGYPRLTVLPGNELGVHSSELLTSPKMRSLIDEITHRYDDRYIVFDLPPLLRNDDALVFSPLVDAVMLVIEAGATASAEVQRSLRLLQGSNLLGTVLNKFK